MGSKWVVRKPEHASIQATCVTCCLEKQRKKTNGNFAAECLPCYKKRQGNRAKKKDYCEKCGFVAEHSIQLDLDHIDGNRYNNIDTNLQTLCANCHRLKTLINKDYRPRYS